MAALLIVLLSGRRSGELVFKGTHGSQDEALLSKLAGMYPNMTFTCIGRTGILLYFHGGFTYRGEEYSGMLNLSLRERDIWGHDYSFDDYEAYLKEYVEKIGEEPNME